jgi:hypothetical protein
MAGGSHLTATAATILGSPIGRPRRAIGPIPSSGQDMSGQGHRTFDEALARFAAGVADGHVTAIAERAAAPLRVVVRGRRGVGRRTVAGVLGRAGIASGLLVTTRPLGTEPGLDEDVVVYVVAEVLKPEDIEAIAAARSPVLAVLNKADLAGSLSGRGGDGPIAAAQLRCVQLAALAGVPMEPMIGLLAGAALDVLDREVWAAVRLLAAGSGGAAAAQTLFDCSCDGFLAPDDPDNPVPIGVRQRLLDGLDLFGTALAVAAVRRGATAPQVQALLRRVSGVDAVVDKVGAVGAEARYRRVLDAVAELEAFGVTEAVTDEGIAEQIRGFLSGDDAVVARMAAAVDLAEASGLDVGDCADPAAHLPRARRWQRYRFQSRGDGGPVSDLHRACSADIARGSLRLWAQARARGDVR